MQLYNEFTLKAAEPPTMLRCLRFMLLVLAAKIKPTTKLLAKRVLKKRKETTMLQKRKETAMSQKRKETTMLQKTKIER